MPVRKKRQPETSQLPNPKIVVRDLTTIMPYSNNPRDNEDAVQSVANSIKNFGFLVPIVIDSKDVIVAGHTRYEAAKSLGLAEAPCIVAEHLTPKQIRAFRLIDNKVSELARWDIDLLANELTALSDSGINFVEFGWSAEEVDCLTDVVAEDCLSAGSAADVHTGARRTEPRAPRQARFVCAEFVFFVPQGVMRRWADHIRTHCDFDEEEITIHLKELLGITPYED